MNSTAARPGGSAYFDLSQMFGRAFTVPLAVARGINERLPAEPPSFALAQVLNQLLLPRLDASTRAALGQRAVEVHISDLGLRCRLMLDANELPGFSPAARDAPVAVRIVAPAEAFWRLASGREDPDTLFFERVLVMEGDTDYALLLKNSLDAAGPLQLTALRPPSPRQALDAARTLAWTARQMLPGFVRR